MSGANTATFMSKQKPQPRRPEGIKLLADCSDFHCGSSIGLMPPQYTTLEGFTVNASPFQLWLWECWLDWIEFVKQVRGADKMAVVFNGDCIEGIHHGTKQVVSADTGDHKGIAIKCLKPLADLSSVAYMVKGTPCHVNSSEVSIAHALNLQINPDFPRAKDSDTEPPEGAYVFQRLNLEVCGVPIVARHHMPASLRRNLAATQFSIQLGEEQLEAANNGEPIPRILLMAHRHKTGHWQDDNGMAIVTGAWQGLTEFGHKIVSPSRVVPSGYILDWRGKDHGELPLVHFRRYRTPAATVIKL